MYIVIKLEGIYKTEADCMECTWFEYELGREETHKRGSEHTAQTGHIVKITDTQETTYCPPDRAQ